MKLRIFVAAAAVLLTACEAKQNGSVDAVVALDTEDQKASYSMGRGLAHRIQQDGLPLDIEIFMQGMRDTFDGKEALLTDQEMAEVMQSFQTRQVASQQEKFETDAQVNLKAAEEFLAVNSAKDSVVTLESGLQYKVLQAGDGEKPGAEDTVEVHYRGTLIDGSEFDSSYSRGEAVTFPVNAVIPGWTEALQLMPVGSKWELTIPPQLGYGAGGTGGKIGPNAALIFEVELVSIVAK